MSNYDVNLFSSKDKANRTGFATKWQLKNTKQLGKSLKMLTDAGLEWVQGSFKPLERLRNVEFSRDWGLPQQNIIIPQDERIITAGVQFNDKKSNQLRYQFTNYNKATKYHFLT